MAQTPAHPGGIGQLVGLPLQHPYLSVAGAALLGLAAVAALIAILGDPRAGAPRVRVSLAHVGAMAPAGWRAALSAEQADAPITLDSLKFNEDVNMAGRGALGRDAIITMPDAVSGARRPLPVAPISALAQPGPGGLLPIIGPDGRTPAQAYARPFQDIGKPKVALVVGGLGLNAKTTREAIERLPAEITLSFVPYADGLQGWIDLARANGHEVLLETPMEPLDYPDNDPGPYTLMANDPATETVRRLEWLMSRATGYFGVTNYLGGRFVNSDKGMSAFLGALRQRGLAFVDDGSATRRGGGLPRLSADRIIDDQLDGDAINRQLQALEASAVRRGGAMGSAFAYPLTLQQVEQWANGLSQRGYALAPASAVMTVR